MRFACASLLAVAACDSVWGLDEVEGPGPPPTDGLIAHWPFDEGTGDMAFDASPSGFHGRLMNGTAWRAGRVGPSALYFDGVDDYVALGDVLSMTTSFSVTAWMFADEVASVDNRIVTHGIGDGARNWTFRDEYGRMMFEVSPDGTTEATRYDARTTPLQTWVHVAGVYDADAQTLDIFRDGERVNGGGSTEIPSSLPGARADSTIGRNGPTGDRLMTGILDDIRIYTRALTTDEIRATYYAP